MNARDWAASVLLFVAMSGLSFFLATADLPHSNNPVNAESVAAILVNNDISELHCGNIEVARKTCRNYPFREILALGEREQPPTLTAVLGGLDDLRKRGLRIGLLYLTGHGSLIHSADLPNGEACIMLKDAPLCAREIAERLGNGPCVIYTDACFAPDFVERLAAHLQGKFLLLSDKPTKTPQQSCRGVSVRFWERVERNAAGGSWWDASMKAWKETCPGGQWIQIDNNPIPPLPKKAIVLHPVTNFEKTETGDR